MAISTPSVLNSKNIASPGTSLASDSISPSANALLIVIVGLHGRSTTTPPGVNSMSTTLSGVTFTEVVNPTSIGSTHCVEVSIWVGQCGASPGSGTVTAGWANSCGRVRMNVIEVTGHDTTTPVVQSKSNGNTSGTTLSMTLDATPGTNNLVLGAVCWRAATSGNDATPGTNFTETTEGISAGTSSTAGLEVEHDQGSATTTVDWSTLTSAVEHVGAAIEIAEASGGAVTVTPAAATAGAAVVAPTVVLGGITIIPAAATAQTGAIITRRYVDGYGGDFNTVEDTTLTNTAPDYCLGGHDAFEADPDVQNGMIRSKPSAIAASKIVVRARLHMYKTDSVSTVPVTLTAYLVAAANADWVPGTKNLEPASAGDPTWNNKAHPSTPWAGLPGCRMAGTDYNATAVGSFAFNSGDAVGTHYVMDLDVSVVQAWLGQSTNPGLVLIPTGPGNGRHLGWSEQTTTGYRPWFEYEVMDPPELLVMPAPATAAAGTLDPTVVLGGIAITPAAVTAGAGTVGPTVVLGGITITPAAVTAAAGVLEPGVVLGAIVITPNPAAAAADVVDPTVIDGTGGVTVTPAPATAGAGTGAPTVVLGGITITPAAVATAAGVGEPGVILGAITILPDLVSAGAGTAGPVVVLGGIVIIPVPASAAAIALLAGAGATVIISREFAAWITRKVNSQGRITRAVKKDARLEDE